MQGREVNWSLQEYGRGIIGGLLFSLPMLFTMEVWETSFQVVPWRLILYMAMTFMLLLAYNTYAGLRPSASWKEVVIDSVEEMGLGLVLSFLFLWLLGLLNFSAMSLERILYLVTVEAMPVAIGVSVGTAQLGATPDETPEKEESDGVSGTTVQKATTQEAVLLAACAGILFGANISPTDEVALLASFITPLQMLLMLLVSLLLSAFVLFYIGFRGAYETPSNQLPTALEMLWSVSITYATAFCVSAGALWFFGRFDNVTLKGGVHMTVVLAIVSSLGASAGRLLFDQEYKDDHEKKST